jgi:hypothetical protein
MPWPTEDEDMQGEGNKSLVVATTQAEPPHFEPPRDTSSSLGDNTLLLKAIDGEGGFISEYVKDRARLGDTPHEFHAAAGLTLVAAAAGNRYKWYAHGAPKHPNIYVVTIGPSGVRKSTGVNLGKDILEEALPATPNVVLPTSFSRESFGEALERRPDGILMFSELSEFLRKAKKKDYLAGIIDHLTDVWDMPNRIVSKFMSRSFTIEKPAPSLIGATTPDRLIEVTDIGDLRGGFLVRFLLVVANNPGPEQALNTTAWPTTSLTDALKEIAANKGEIDFEQVTLVIGAAEKDYKIGLRQRGANPDLAGMYSRFETQTMKVASLFMLSRTHGTNLRVRDEDVLRASKLVTYSNSQMEAFPFSFTPTAKILKRLEEMIDARPGITQRDVLRALGNTVKDLKVLVSTVEAMGYTTTSNPIQGGIQVQYWPPGYVS